MVKSFLGKGIQFPFQVNSVGGLSMSAGPSNIEEAIRCIIGTAVGERVMRPQFGCRIHEFVFHPNSPSTAGMVEFYVREALHKWEPRIENIVVEASPDTDNLSLMNVNITYRVRSTNQDRNMVYPFYLRREQDL